MKEIIKQNFKFILLSSLVVILTAVTAIITPVILQLFDAQQRSDSFQLIGYVVFAMTLSMILQLITLVYRENYAAKFNVGYLFQLIGKMLKMDYDAYVDLEPTYLINRIFTAVDNLYLFLINGFSTLTKAIFMILCSLILVGSVSLKIFAVMLVLIPFNYFSFRYINRELSRKMAAMQAASATANKDLVVTLANSDMVKAQMDHEILDNLLFHKIEAMYQSLANTNKFAQTTSTLIGFVNQVFQNVVYIWTSLLIAQGELALSNLIIFSIVLPLFFTALSDLTKVNIDFKTLGTANDFIHDELEANAEKDGTLAVTTIESIQLNHPKFVNHGRVFHFPVKTELRSGDVVYLSGPSGSGKSSLLKLLLKFRPSEGLTINEQPISQLQNAALRRKIAYLAQDATVLSASIEENLGYGRKLTPAEKQLIEDSGILAPIFKDKDWDTLLVENGANLSGGERQRLAVARLLLKDADLYILDESTSNIDEASAQAIFETILTHKKEKIILFTSHDSRNQRYATKTIKLTGGSSHE